VRVESSSVSNAEAKRLELGRERACRKSWDMVKNKKDKK